MRTHAMIHKDMRGEFCFNHNLQFDLDKDTQPGDCDFDKDGDGIPNWNDLCHELVLPGQTGDINGDGCFGDPEFGLTDFDFDNDGFQLYRDLCERGVSNWLKESHLFNRTYDNDDDGCHDFLEDSDDDNDGFEDRSDDCPLRDNGHIDLDGDGLCEGDDLDDDGDNYSDLDEVSCGSNSTDFSSLPSDLDSDMICDEIDSDIDGDNVSNSEDAFPYDVNEWNDLDSDGVGNNSDDCVGTFGTSTVDRIGCLDQDGDGVSDLNDIEPYNADVGLDEYDGPRKDLPEVVDDEINKTATKSDDTSSTLAGVGVPIGGALSIIVIALLIRRFRAEREDDDDDEYVNEEYHSIDTNVEQQEDSRQATPDFDTTGEAHESGYEVLEYPVGSEKWWWKDEENQCWVPWE